MAINEALVSEYLDAKRESEEAKERFDKIENELAQDMLVQEIKSDLVSVSGHDYKVTVVAGETTKVDAEALKLAMGAVKFRRVTKTRVDTKLLEDAIRKGLVDMDTVANCVEIRPSKPYVKVTPTVADHE